MKDFYDVYYFLNNLKNEIDMNILKEAIKNTFIKRDSFEYLNDYEKIIISIKSNEKIKNLWQIYSNKYANNINIEKILDMLLKVINELNVETIAV